MLKHRIPVCGDILDLVLLWMKCVPVEGRGAVSSFHGAMVPAPCHPQPTAPPEILSVRVSVLPSFSTCG